MEYESAFLIRSPEKIVSKLSILLKNKCLLSVFFGESNDSFITTILDIYVKNDYITFYHGPKEDLIDKLVNSKNITFKTEYFGIKVVFEATKLAKVQHQGLVVFVIPIPDSMLWIESRDFYRVKSPISKSSYCQVILKDRKQISLKLYDISLVGFSMLNNSKEISDNMTLDMHFEQCKLLLADTGEDTISFKIRRKNIINIGNLNRVEKIGCKFTKIAPEFESVIRNYMLSVKR
jgi:flagellar brake protein